MFGPSWPGSLPHSTPSARSLAYPPRHSFVGLCTPQSPGSLADNASKTANAMLVETTGTLFPAGRALVGGLSKTTNCDDNIE